MVYWINNRGFWIESVLKLWAEGVCQKAPSRRLLPCNNTEVIYNRSPNNDHCVKRQPVFALFWKVNREEMLHRNCRDTRLADAWPSQPHFVDAFKTREVFFANQNFQSVSRGWIVTCCASTGEFEGPIGLAILFSTCIASARRWHLHTCSCNATTPSFFASCPSDEIPTARQAAARPPPTSHFSIQIAETGSVFLLVVSFNWWRRVNYGAYHEVFRSDVLNAS